MAAGNDNIDLDDPQIGQKIYPMMFNSDYIITVANTTETDELLYCHDAGSNWGVTFVDMAAPGTNILTTDLANRGSYSFLLGTSLSAPHVAGVIGLMYTAVREDFLSYHDTEHRNEKQSLWNDPIAR